MEKAKKKRERREVEWDGELLLLRLTVFFVPKAAASSTKGHRSVDESRGLPSPSMIRFPVSQRGVGKVCILESPGERSFFRRISSRLEREKGKEEERREEMFSKRGGYLVQVQGYLDRSVRIKRVLSQKGPKKL